MQFPQRSGLEIRPVKHSGHDNRTFHLGGDMAVCLPSGPAYVAQVEKEAKWLPALAQGLSLPISSPIPEGFDVIELPAATYLMFQGEPFAEEDFCQAIGAVQAAMDRYDPGFMGYRWDVNNPRIQLEPRGERGYIELRAVKR